jgi:hypothetical protein
MDNFWYLEIKEEDFSFMTGKLPKIIEPWMLIPVFALGFSGIPLNLLK